MARFEFLQFCILMLAIPVQYLIVSKWSLKGIEQTQALKTFTSQITNGINYYFSYHTWFNWLISSVLEIPLGFNPFIHPQTWRRGIESPASEVYLHREKYGYFGNSPETRSSRPENVKYRVGQVIRHKRYGYRAVIIGWDITAKAPESWISEHHHGHPEYSTQPNYAVLLDTRDRKAHKTYIPQEEIQVVTSTKIVNAQLEDYFELYDGAQYIMKPWMKEVYPHD